MASGPPPVWVLLGQKTGDNNQLLRLASELGVPFRAVELRYNSLHRVPPALLAPTFASLDAASRRELRPPWPELVLGIGNRSVPAALEIRRRSLGRSKLVRLGNPRMDPANFDLVITTCQYAVPERSNVIALPVGISTAPSLNPTREEREWLGRQQRPHRLLLIGGATFMWRLTPAAVAAAASSLLAKGGSVIAVSSARTSDALMNGVASALTGRDHALVSGSFPRYPVLLQDADEIAVTADSVAMVSDAVSTGKPVGLVLPEKTLLGRLFYRGADVGLPVPVRDIRRFWTNVLQKRLAGTLQEPLAGRLDHDPVERAVAAVRRLLGR